MGVEEGSNYFIILYYFLLPHIFFKSQKNNQYFQGSDQEEKIQGQSHILTRLNTKQDVVCGQYAVICCAHRWLLLQPSHCSCYTLLERKNAAGAPPSSGALSSTHP